MSAPTPFWSYRAVDGAGRRHRGVLAAASPAMVVRTLEAHGLVVVETAPARGSGAAGVGLDWHPGTRRDVLEATRAVGALLAAGVPLPRSLATAAAIVPGRVARALDGIRAGVASGESLTASLAHHPRLFSPLYLGVVRAGERSGRLAESFLALAAQLERSDRLRARLLSASIYPLILSVAGMAAVGVLLFVVLPRFAELLADTRATLPRSTASLLAFADVLQGGWPWLLATLLGVLAAASLAARTVAGQRARASAILALPVVGGIRRYALAGQLARVLGVLLAGGTALLGALEEAQDSLADPLARDEVARVRRRVRDGASLGTAIAEGSLFPPALARLVAVGEEGGALEPFLARAAEICEEKADRSLQRLASLVEPGMILLLGGLIALVAMALLQAIYGVDAGAFR
ncbi:MAG TPA: type II secretion system F family protein [Gemmatimonadaceae bacterium]